MKYSAVLEFLCLLAIALVAASTAHGGFTESAVFGASGTIAVAWGDYDLDGHLDLAVGNGDFGSADTNFLYINNRDSTFAETPEFGLGSTDGVAWGDCDNDGDLDLAAGNEHSPATNYLYTNDEGGDDYLIVRLVGHYHDMGIPYSNRDGIGAKITLYEAGHLGEAGYILGYREVCAHGGFASQNSIDAHVGVAGAATVDMRVVWPGSGGSSVSQDAGGVATGHRLVIHETDTASVGKRNSLPGISLSEARPNPLDGLSTMWFSIPNRAAVRAFVYDVQGKLVATVLDDVFPAGRHSFAWDGKDIDGNDVTQGVYFCRFSADDPLEVRKIVALR